MSLQYRLLILLLTIHSEHTKQTDLGWGANTAESEFADERAGKKIAEEEGKEDGWDANDSGAPGWDTGGAPGFKDVAAPTEAPWDGGAGAQGFKDSPAPVDGDSGDVAAGEPITEPEDSHKSYADYMIEQNAKKSEALGVLAPRPANEGSKQDKKWSRAKELSKADEEAAYFQGAENKARRERDRHRNVKEKLDLDYRYNEPGTRGEGRGRGRGRGDRGDFRGRGRGRGDVGDRGDGGFRGRGDGDFRGGRGRGEHRGDRGELRGGRGRGRGGRESGEGPPVALNDEAAFPSLGGK